MGNGFFGYLQQLEMLAFFSGYALVYLSIRIFCGNQSLKDKSSVKYVSLLPFAYALIGTLYLGLQIRNLYPDFTMANISHKIPQIYLALWGLLSILFWVPFFSEKPVLSLLHSLLFFFLILRDLFFQITGMVSDKNLLQNDMRIYSVSLVLNLAAYIFIFLLNFLEGIRKKHSNS